VVACAEDSLGRIGSEVNHVHGPMRRLVDSEGRGVGGAEDLVAVALGAEEEDCFRDGADPERMMPEASGPVHSVRGSVGVDTSVLANKSLYQSGVLIEEVVGFDEVVRHVVVMVVLHLADRRVNFQSVRDESDIGMSGFNSSVVGVVSVLVVDETTIQVVLVAEFDVSYIPWLGMTILSTECTILGLQLSDIEDSTIQH